jgi:hypothetical protein
MVTLGVSKGIRIEEKSSEKERNVLPIHWFTCKNGVKIERLPTLEVHYQKSLRHLYPSERRQILMSIEDIDRFCLERHGFPVFSVKYDCLVIVSFEN